MVDKCSPRSQVFVRTEVIRYAKCLFVTLSPTGKYIYEINDCNICDKDEKSTTKVEIENETEKTAESSHQNNGIDWDKHRNTLNPDMVDMLKNKDEKENKREENEGESTEENDKRPSCLYGKVGCTRKNPQHFIAEAHPGDDDYVEISQSVFCIIKQRTYF